MIVGFSYDHISGYIVCGFGPWKTILKCLWGKHLCTHPHSTEAGGYIFVQNLIIFKL